MVLLGDVGDVAGDFFLTELGLAGVDLVLLDVDRGEAAGGVEVELVAFAVHRHLGSPSSRAE